MKHYLVNKIGGSIKLKTLNHCTECDLSGVDLSGANLTEANLKKANLTKADLEYATLTNADLTGAKLRDVIIEGAIFCNTKTPWGLDNSGCK